MRRTYSLCVSVAAGAALVALGPAPAQAQCFKITDLGQIGSGGPPGPFGINNLNQAEEEKGTGYFLEKVACPLFLREDYHEWLAQAGDAEALASGWVLYALLTDGA